MMWLGTRLSWFELAHSKPLFLEVNAGRWSEVAYHEYQRLAASSGHVDSARLLLLVRCECGCGRSMRRRKGCRRRRGVGFAHTCQAL
jgi:hypothetical protein